MAVNEHLVEYGTQLQRVRFFVFDGIVETGQKPWHVRYGLFGVTEYRITGRHLGLGIFPGFVAFIGQCIFGQYFMYRSYEGFVEIGTLVFQDIIVGIELVHYFERFQ